MLPAQDTATPGHFGFGNSPRPMAVPQDCALSPCSGAVTSLSNICRELNVTLVRDWNSGLPEYWGDVGHYTIGFFACDKLSGKIGKLMKANQENVSYPTDTITSRKGIKLRGPDGFVRLADVPDRIWKIPGGKAARGNFENPNHFADMDQQLPDSPNKGKTLLELCDDPVNVDPDVWMNYYTRVKDSEKGLLPFRVWQFFDEMVDAALQQDVKRFVCAAGIVAHYVGDSCQPLHISFLYNGEPMVAGSLENRAGARRRGPEVTFQW